MKFKDFLISINACPDARDWVGDMDPETAWETSRRGDWMEWIIIECQPEVIAARAALNTASAALATARAAYNTAYATARDTALNTAYADAIREVYPTLPETIKAALND